MSHFKTQTKHALV